MTDKKLDPEQGALKVEEQVPKPLFEVRKDGEVYALYVMGYPLDYHKQVLNVVIEQARIVSDAIAIYPELDQGEAVIKYVSGLIVAEEHGDLDFENINWEAIK